MMMKINDPFHDDAYIDQIDELTISKIYRDNEYDGIYISDDAGIDLWFWDEDQAIKAAKIILKYFGDKNEK